ncbi:MAG: outer membrane lipoprotein chaperone LolA [Bacteroidota bacterium]
MNRFIVHFLALVLVVVAADGRQQEATVKNITDNVQRRYEAMRDATAKFTQHVKFSFSKIEQNFEGTLTMKKPNKYRIESEHQTFVTDGSVVWSYSPVNKQVLVDRFKENQSTLSPDKLLLNLPAQYYTTLLGKENVDRAETFVLKLVPKDDQAFIRSVKVWVEDGTWVVRRVLVVDVNETETQYMLKEIKLNTHVNDSLFSFSPPPGTEVVDLR